MGRLLWVNAVERDLQAGSSSSSSRLSGNVHIYIVCCDKPKMVLKSGYLLFAELVKLAWRW